MKYPKFLKENDTVGVCALSAGVGKKLEEYDASLDILRFNGYKIKEKGNVRINDERGGSAKSRANALKTLYKDKDVDMVMCAAGGDFCYEVLPYIDLETIKENPKWFMGYSDPTSVCLMITTKLDIATIYGLNAGSYEELKYCEDNLSIIKGDLITQYSYELYEDKEGFLSDERMFIHPVYWKGNNKETKFKGRCIGGCLDVIKDMIGTDYIDMDNFNDKYKDDGIIWYFDIFAMSSENVYRTLLQMKAAGYFKYTKGILFGRVLFDSSFTEMTYEDAYNMAIGDLPYLMDVDIGHSSPSMTMINGAIIEVESSKGKGFINFILK